jgi:thiosulfate reductase cytochrome b subunit
VGLLGQGAPAVRREALSNLRYTLGMAETVRGHAGYVRLTHWLTVLCFLALLVTGVEILISHPRFYWGNAGYVGAEPLFRIPIPSSRGIVPTGYGYVLPDQNGWSRYLHFQSAWAVGFTGLMYLILGLARGHFRRNLVPAAGTLNTGSMMAVIQDHLRGSHAAGEAYNVLQRLTYLTVIFVLFPLVVWTGLAMAPAFEGALPGAVALLGGRQSARTIHFFVTIALTLFLVTHVALVAISGFQKRLRAMTLGAAEVSR